MYNPVGEGDYEFIELKNFGDAEFSLVGMYFTGIDFTFPQSTPPLAPGDFILLVRDPTAFAERYPGVDIDGVYQGQLSNSGETITLRNPKGTDLISITYDDQNSWPVSPDGRGDTLILANPLGDPNEAKNWRASNKLHGSPGTNDAP